MKRLITKFTAGVFIPLICFSCNGGSGNTPGPVNTNYLGTYSGLTAISLSGQTINDNRTVVIQESANSGKYVISAPGSFAGSYTVDIVNDSFYIDRTYAGSLGQGQDIYDWGGGKIVGNSLRINFFQEVTGSVVANAVGTLQKK